MTRSGYFGCTCPAMDVPHCHTGGDCPPETPRTQFQRHCVYRGIGCNVDHDAIARLCGSTDEKVDHLLWTVDRR